jgi:hypothetical protein
MRSIAHMRRPGNLSSGNADADSMKYATGFANSTYNSYLSGLSPYLGANSSAVSGAAGVDAALGSGLNTSYTNQGNAANTTQTTIGNNNAAAEMNNYKVGANQLNGLMGLEASQWAALAGWVDWAG